ncbi:19837_t:CDS:2 [Cetraspora pellucida]|uniref:19837_t:CDS:1 n=1 Tax=Cetraspora pellucida TaxID=1433469 RepID=A0A9N9B521_9GLOM|nr:19837_t:CDS:2 [Cetraspora pellucida]
MLSKAAKPHWAARWEPSSTFANAHFPNDAFFNDNGEAIGRGWYESSLQLGRVVIGRGLIIGYGGKEIVLEDYEILCGNFEYFQWIRRHGPYKPALWVVPLEAGHESDQRELYVARTLHNGHYIYGKAGWQGMSYAVDGREFCAKDYEILTIGR